jgi:2-C-methyl-D-erythritol 4-phosphate cytidylyltransferase
MRYWLVMPAAGAGRRFGSAKQYARLGAHTVLETALQPFLDDARCAGGALVLAADDEHRGELARRLGPRLAVVQGGAERVHSVRNGVAALGGRAAADDWVLVHDAARPCLSGADLTRLLQVGAEDAVGALLAVPVADTLKRAAADAGGATGATVRAAADAAAEVPRVGLTEAREGLWLAQTPQMFRHGALLAALEHALAIGRTPTDEAQAMEWMGLGARLVHTREANLKVTNAADLALAQAILAARERQCV